MIIKKKLYSIAELTHLLGKHHPVMYFLIKNARDITLETGNVVKERLDLMDWLQSNVKGVATLENQFDDKENEAMQGRGRFCAFLLNSKKTWQCFL